MNSADDTSNDSIGLVKSSIHDPYSSLHVWENGVGKIILEKLKEQGIEPFRTKWQPHEVMQLELNVKKLQEEFLNIDIIQLFYLSGSEHKFLKKKHDILKKASFHIQRTLTSISDKIRHHFKSQAGFKTVPYTADELERIAQLVKVHGKNWPLISQKTNRFRSDLSTKYHLRFVNNLIHGRWTANEIERMELLVKTTMNPKEIDWRVVSAYMGRSNKSCRSKWVYLKSFKQGIKLKSQFSPIFNIALIIALYHSGVVKHEDINWDELVSLFRFKFRQTRMMNQLKYLEAGMPTQCNMSFRNSLEYLYDKYCNRDFIKPEINFNYISTIMKHKKSPYWLRAKFFLLKQVVSNHENMFSEEVIDAMEKKYLNKKVANTTSRNGESISDGENIDKQQLALHEVNCNVECEKFRKRKSDPISSGSNKIFYDSVPCSKYETRCQHQDMTENARTLECGREKTLMSPKHKRNISIDLTICDPADTHVARATGKENVIIIDD